MINYFKQFFSEEVVETKLNDFAREKFGMNFKFPRFSAPCFDDGDCQNEF